MASATIPYRYLTLWHEERILNDTMPELRPGEAAFRSYYLPSLEGGTHTVTVKQVVINPDAPQNEVRTKEAEMQQKFTVIAPRYKLVEDIVDSVFPPPGHSVLPKILPHIVVKDPHFPWVRNPKPITSLGQDTYTGVPWVALITFTPDELQITDGSIFSAFDPKRVQNENLAFEMTAEEIKKINPTNATVVAANPRPREVNEKVSVITIKKGLFLKLFTENGKIDISQYKYLSHVRKVATDGMISAMHGQSGTYSMIVSHRLGPLETKTPTPLIAHLVSLEKIHDLNMATVKENVVMTSLYSWTYTSLPPDSFDAAKAMRQLGDTLTVLRTDQGAPASGGLCNDPIEDLITKRQKDGYSIVRHRTVTGEETAAIYRGPLTPTFVAHRVDGINTIQSNFGTDLQILDPDLSLMDITYATAWQLGKTLAMGDTAFTAALSRVRRHMHMEALKESQKDVHCKLEAYMSRDTVLKNIKDLVKGLETLNTNLHKDGKTAISTNRWQKTSVEKVDISLKSPHIYSKIYANSVPVAIDMASSTDGNLFNHHNVPSNTDYAQVLSWVQDKLNLAGVPAHYLIPDKSYLPEETLRFFYIDENWTDALTDGALSLANQWTNKPNEDYCRSALKYAIGQYLIKPQEKLNYRPQMPRYGFLLRSQLLVQFPDLTVTAEFDRPIRALDEKPKAPILIHRKLAADIMLCLFDCTPPELKSIKFTLPAHQQTFSMGVEINNNNLRLGIKTMYTVDPDKAAKPPNSGEFLDIKDYPKSESKIFDWESRTMKISAFAKEVHTLVRTGMKGDFDEPEATSAMLALQLNEPIYTLDIGAIAANALPKDVNDAPFQFLVPEFPAHLYPAPPLPRPLCRQRQTLSRLNRPVPSPPVVAPPLPEPKFNNPETKISRPAFLLRVHTFDNLDYIPTNRKLPQDLIFSITRQARPDDAYTLMKLTLHIPVGKFVPKAKGYLPLLTKDYDPPYPCMLSNLRFNLFRKWDHDNLVVELVPRRKEGIDLNHVAEASFMLSLAEIIPWVSEEECEIRMVPEYKGYPPGLWYEKTIVTMKPEPPKAKQAEAEGWEYVSDEDSDF